VTNVLGRDTPRADEALSGRSTCAKLRLMSDLRERMARLGRELGERESAHRAELEEARRRAAALRAELAEALAAFREAVVPPEPPTSRCGSGSCARTTSTCARSSSTSRAAGIGPS
jgi:hypothetical protein